MNLDIGCGPNKPEGFVGIDHFAFEGVDIVGKLEDPNTWHDIENDSCEIVRAHHVLEHFDGHDLIFIIEQAWKKLKDQGRFSVELPSKGSPNCGKDFTHKKKDWDEFSFQMWEKRDGEYIIERGPMYHIAGEFKLDGTAVNNNMDRSYVLTAIKTWEDYAERVPG